METDIGEFYYECHKCKEKIPGFFKTNATDPIKMVPGEKPNEFLFECLKCFEVKD